MSHTTQTLKMIDKWLPTFRGAGHQGFATGRLAEGHQGAANWWFQGSFPLGKLRWCSPNPDSFKTLKSWCSQEKENPMWHSTTMIYNLMLIIENHRESCDCRSLMHERLTIFIYPICEFQSASYRDTAIYCVQWLLRWIYSYILL